MKLQRLVVAASLEAKEMCSRRACKFISISAILNHRVDELLVGTVCQIRLHRSSMAQAAAAVAAQQASAQESSAATGGPAGWLQRLLLRRHKDSPRPCENLLIL